MIRIDVVEAGSIKAGLIQKLGRPFKLPGPEISLATHQSLHINEKLSAAVHRILDGVSGA